MLRTAFCSWHQHQPPTHQQNRANPNRWAEQAHNTTTEQERTKATHNSRTAHTHTHTIIGTNTPLEGCCTEEEATP